MQVVLAFRLPYHISPVIYVTFLSTISFLCKPEMHAEVFASVVCLTCLIIEGKLREFILGVIVSKERLLISVKVFPL